MGGPRRLRRDMWEASGGVEFELSQKGTRRKREPPHLSRYSITLSYPGQVRSSDHYRKWGVKGGPSEAGDQCRCVSCLAGHPPGQVDTPIAYANETRAACDLEGGGETKEVKECRNRAEWARSMAARIRSGRRPGPKP
jgi:hypothetical protein